MNFVDMMTDKNMYKRFTTSQGIPFSHISSDFVPWKIVTDKSVPAVSTGEILLGKFVPITSGKVNINMRYTTDEYFTYETKIWYKVYENDVLIGESNHSTIFYRSTQHDDRDSSYPLKDISLKAFNEYKITCELTTTQGVGENFGSVEEYEGSARYHIYGYIADELSRYFITKG